MTKAGFILHILKHLVQLLHPAGTLLGKHLAIAGQVAQLSDRRWLSHLKYGVCSCRRVTPFPDLHWQDIVKQSNGATASPAILQILSRLLIVSMHIKGVEAATETTSGS